MFCKSLKHVKAFNLSLTLRLSFCSLSFLSNFNFFNYFNEDRSDHPIRPDLGSNIRPTQKDEKFIRSTTLNFSFLPFISEFENRPRYHLPRSGFV